MADPTLKDVLVQIEELKKLIESVDSELGDLECRVSDVESEVGECKEMDEDDE